MSLRIFALLGITTLLSGCGPLLNDTYFTSKRIQSRDWAVQGGTYIPKKVYCYKSLGGADCYHEEQPKRRNQLIEAYEEQAIAMEDGSHTRQNTMTPLPLYGFND